MPNFQRPVTPDVTVGNWGSTPLWSKINQAIPDDAADVQSENDPSNDIMEVTLETLTDPAISTGHIVRIRMAKGSSGGGQPGTINAIVGLYQTTTLIATATFSNISTGFATVTFTLSGSEADNITDYDDLRVRVDADKSAGARTSWLEVSGIEFETPSAAADHNQRAFRIRSSDPAIDANGGGDWDQLENVNASIDLDFLFRLRFEIEETSSNSDGGVTYKLQFRVNIQSAGYGSWTDVPVGISVDSTPLGATWPVTEDTDEAFIEHFGVMILAGERPPGFSNNAATGDILTTSASLFVAGVGMHDNLSTTITLNNQHTELEWPIVISRWYDGAGGAGSIGRKYDDGDTFQFRVVESDSTLFTGDTNSGYDNIPEITAADRIGHIGSTHIEEPDHIGPFKDGNGALYYFSEYTNESNLLLLQKSTDGGDTWDEATVTGRPDASDPEGVDVFQEGDDILHIITHRGSDLIEYQEYFMSSHGSPDTWNTIDDQIDADAGNPGNGDGCSIIKRPSDGKIFVFYMGLESADATLWYTNDNADGMWQSRLEVDTGGGELAGAHAVLNPVTSDIWFFYMDQANLDIYVRKLAAGGTTVGSRTLVGSTTFDVNQENNTLRGVYYDDDLVEVIMFTWHERNGGDFNEFRTMRNGSLQTSGIATEFDVERSGGGGHSGVADISVDGKTVHVLYSRLSDQDIYHAENDDEGGFGPTDVEEKDAVQVFYIRQNIFTHSSGNGGDTVLGYMYEDGPDGRNAGFIEYDEVVLATGGADTIDLDLLSSTVFYSPTVAASDFEMNTLSSTVFYSIFLDGTVDLTALSSTVFYTLILDGTIALDLLSSTSFPSITVASSDFQLDTLASTVLYNPRLDGTVELTVLSSTVFFSPTLHGTVDLDLLSSTVLHSIFLDGEVLLALLSSTTFPAINLVGVIDLDHLSSTVFHSPTLDGEVLLNLLNSTTFPSNTVAFSDLTMALLSSTVFYSPTLDGEILLTHLNSSTFFSIFLDGAIDLDLLSSTVFYSPQLDGEILLDNLSSSVFYAISISSGFTMDLLTSTVFYSPQLDGEILLDNLASTVFYSITVTTPAVTPLDMDLLDSTTFPTLALVGVIDLTSLSTTVFYTPQLDGNIVLDQLSSSTFPSITVGEASIDLDHLVSRGFGGYVLLDGTDDVVSTPNSVPLQIVGDLEIIMLLLPHSLANSPGYVDKFGGNFGYRLIGSPNGQVQYAWGDGSAQHFEFSGVILLPNKVKWIRMTHEVDDGGGQNVVRWFFSADPIGTDRLAVSWTADQVDTQAGTTSIATNTNNLVIGERDTIAALNGRFYGVWIYDGIGGTEVASPDWRDDKQGWSSPPGIDEQGNVWTFQDDASWIPEPLSLGANIDLDALTSTVLFTLTVGEASVDLDPLSTTVFYSIAVVDPGAAAVGVQLPMRGVDR